MENPIRFLLIDDEPDFLNAISFWMKSKGYHVLTATDGASGIEKVKKGEADVVFVDYKMPDMDGLEVLKKIREFDEKIPVVMVTAHANELVFYNANHLSISGFFSKMLTFDELEEFLGAVLKKLNELKTPRDEKG